MEKAAEENGEIERLAETLFWKMEHIDPVSDANTWDELPDNERAFYRSCIEAVLVEQERIRYERRPDTT